jgi:NAD(P)-dependent dehydrogenase (short-subunit alcohol dehydrogenase family)
VLQATPADWLFTFSVNVFGVANTLRSFVPSMVQRGVPAAIVSTSSVAGVVVGGTGPYGASKHACTVLTESLYTEIVATSPNISVHTLHPQIVDTNIDRSQRNKPVDLRTSKTDFLDLGGLGNTLFHERGMPPTKVAADLFRGLDRGDFYIYAENPGDEGWTRRAIISRMQPLVSRRAPQAAPQMKVAQGLFTPRPSIAARLNCHSANSLKGGVAVITGGASGIGLAVAHEALRQGLHVAIGDIEQGALDEAIAELRTAAGAGAEMAVEGFQCDVTDPASCDAFASSVSSSASFGGAAVSLLHCNAGVGAGQSVLQATPADWLFTFSVNVFGVANTLRSFVPSMVQRGAPGAVVTTSSIAGLSSGGGPYGSSKHAVTTLTEALSFELAEGESLNLVDVVQNCTHIASAAHSIRVMIYRYALVTLNLSFWLYHAMRML